MYKRCLEFCCGRCFHYVKLGTETTVVAHWQHVPSVRQSICRRCDVVRSIIHVGLYSACRRQVTGARGQSRNDSCVRCLQLCSDVSLQVPADHDRHTWPVRLLTLLRLLMIGRPKAV